MRNRAILIACLLAAGFIFLQVGSAQAHSVLVSSNPPSGAKLAAPPANVQMTFSEGVEPSFSSFAVIDRTRKPFQVGAPVIDRVKGQVTVALPPDLAPGSYIVQWKVVSVVDGHLTRGSFAFNVEAAPGAPTPTAAPTSVGGTGEATPQPTLEALPVGDTDIDTGAGSTGEANAPGVLDVAVRWLDTLLAACLVGGAVFGLLVVPGTLAILVEGRKEIAADLEGRYLRGGIVAALLLILMLGAELVLQAMRATETDLGSVFSQPGVLSAVLGSSFGFSLEVRAVEAISIFVLLVVGVVTSRAGRWLCGLIVLLGAGYFWAQTLSAHATALSEEGNAGILQVLAPWANVVHLLATAIWIGGLFYFVVIMLPVLRDLLPKVRSGVLRESVARFSQLALVTVPVVALSGTIIYLAEQPSVDSTLNTGYGREVLIKVGLLAVLMIPAAYNLRKVGPGLQALRDKIGPAFQALAKGFRRSVSTEALLVSVVLVFSALLTLSAPATDPSAYAGESATAVAVAGVVTPEATVPLATSVPPEATATNPPPSTLTLTQTVRGVDVSLDLVHSALDDNVNVTLRDAKGPILGCGATPAADADCVLNMKITFTELDDNASNTVEAPDAGNGSYALPEGPYLPLDGTWQVVVAVRRYNQPEDVRAAFRYELNGADMTGKVSDYVNVDVSTNPDPPRSGPMELTFHLTDNNGQPVNDASITVQGIMPAHGHVTEAEQMSNKDGTYTANLLMPMSGGWSVELSISRTGHDTVAAEVSLDLAASELDLTPYPSPNSTPVGP